MHSSELVSHLLLSLKKKCVKLLFRISRGNLFSLFLKGIIPFGCKAFKDFNKGVYDSNQKMFPCINAEHVLVNFMYHNISNNVKACWLKPYGHIKIAIIHKAGFVWYEFSMFGS